LEQNYLQKHQQQQKIIPFSNKKIFLQSSENTKSEPDLRYNTRKDEDNSRWFVAIQNHKPPICGGVGGGINNNELPFKRHQLIKVFLESGILSFFMDTRHMTVKT
jgi:hypothetical protein